MVKRLLCCVLVVGFLMVVAGTSEAAIIDFEADPTGPYPNGFSAVGHPSVTFTDTIGSDLQVLTG